MIERRGATDDQLARLISAAGHRSTPPAAAYEQTLAAATRVWRSKVRRRRSKIAVGLAAGIAALSISAGVVLQVQRSEPASPTPLAQAARIVGAVQIRSPGSNAWTSLEPSDVLTQGAMVRTSAGAGAGLLLGGVSVRIDEAAEVILESSARVRLAHGRVYVDTGAGHGSGRMEVVSPAASVTDVGTQFEVRYANEDYRVRVREGHVLMRRGGMQRRVDAGEQLRLEPSGDLRRTRIGGDDPEWRWTQALGSAPNIDDQPLTVLLEWVARETGLRVRYATPAVERKASATILHGSLDNLLPLEALTLMLATTDLRHEVLPDGIIMIR